MFVNKIVLLIKNIVKTRGILKKIYIDYNIKKVTNLEERDFEIVN